jgi:hypothetical protein
MSAPAVPTAKDFIARFTNLEEDGRMTLVEEASKALTKNQMNIFKKEIKKIEEEEKAAMSENDTVETPPTTAAGKKPELVKPTPATPVVSEADLNSFWKELESQTGDDLVNESVIQDFQYIGFDPNLILKTIISRGRAAEKGRAEIMSDIAQLCTIAIIKGSITDTNLKKMSDSGKRSYGVLKASYGLKENGSRGVDPDVVTVARVGAAFPGSMMKILLKKPDLAKKFSGPFGSKILPSYLRHQSAAACIPETLENNAREFLLALVTAYTSDQSKVISKTKDTALEIYEKQENFVLQTHSSHYPTIDIRKTIFSSWSLIADYDKLKTVSDSIVKAGKAITLISKEDLQKSIAGV